MNMLIEPLVQWECTDIKCGYISGMAVRGDNPAQCPKCKKDTMRVRGFQNVKMTPVETVENELLQNLESILKAWRLLREDCEDNHARPGTFRAVDEQIANTKRTLALAKKVISRVER